MNHPYELLAGLIDGTLDADDRAQVDAHLAACSACRGDVEAASAGRRAVRSLPVEPAPIDLHGRVVAEAGGRGDAASPRWSRWAGVAAAAALVAAIAIALPDVGGTGAGQPGATDAAGGDPAPESGQASELAPSGEAVVLEVQNDMNYDARSLERLAEGGDRVTAALSGDAGSRDSPAAVRCVTQAFEQQPVGRLTRLIDTRFEGRDAYIAVYLEGPGADEPADTAVAWVASQDDCTILSFAQARL